MSVKRTPLYEEHKKLNAKLVDFSGWEMPLWYDAGHIKEHNAVRNGVGIFDVCHMSEFSISGPSSVKFLEKVCTNNISNLKDYQAQYNFMLNESGGVVDDCIIYKINEQKWSLVANAGTIESDFQHLLKYADSEVTVKNESDDFAKLDLQGPYAPKLLEKVAGRKAVEKLGFYKFREGLKIGGTDIFVSRTGYTGEVGFEIFFWAKDVVRIWNLFLDEGKEFGILPCGLAARDSLRLEAGLPLHGHDIGPDMIATSSLWTFVLSDRDNYLGRDSIKSNSASYFVKPFVVDGRRKAMPGDKMLNSDGSEIGVVLSGVMSPTLNNKPIGFCKSNSDLKEGDSITFTDDSGKKKISAKICSVPFVEGLTWRKKMTNFIDN